MSLIKISIKNNRWLLQLYSTRHLILIHEAPVFPGPLIHRHFFNELEKIIQQGWYLFTRIEVNPAMIHKIHCTNTRVPSKKSLVLIIFLLWGLNKNSFLLAKETRYEDLARHQTAVRSC